MEATLLSLAVLLVLIVVHIVQPLCRSLPTQLRLLCLRRSRLLLLLPFHVLLPLVRLSRLVHVRQRLQRLQ